MQLLSLPDLQGLGSSPSECEPQQAATCKSIFRCARPHGTDPNEVARSLWAPQFPPDEFQRPGDGFASAAPARWVQDYKSGASRRWVRRPEDIRLAAGRRGRLQPAAGPATSSEAPRSGKAEIKGKDEH